MHNQARGKRRLLQRALDSIQFNEPPQRPKVLTETAEPYQQPLILQKPTAKDDKGMRALRRYYRYKQGEEQQTALNKHKSLQMAKRGLKRRSQQRLNHSLERQHPSLDRSPYLPLHQRRLPATNSKEGLAKVISKQSRKLSLPKKVFRSRQQLQSVNIDQLKDLANAAMKKGDYAQALRWVQRVSEGQEVDLQGLEMWGVCLMNLRQFQEAVVRLGRLVMLDQRYSKKAYISLALCQNQLNHADRCLHYVNQCISLFPDYYQAYYFKGKLLFKQRLYAQAIDILLRATVLNPSKRQIKLLIAQCYFFQGENSEALLYYERYLGQITLKNAKQATKYGSLLISSYRQADAVVVLEAVLAVIEGANDVESLRVEANAHLCLAYFRRGNYDLCAMRGEQVLTRGSPAITMQVIKTMITSKILQHDYYGGIYFLRRLENSQAEGKQLRPYVHFLEAVSLLTKRKVEQAVSKLTQLPGLLAEHGLDEFTTYINRTFRLFLIYGLFLIGKYKECIEIVSNQRQVGIQAYWKDSLGYIQHVCRGMIAYNKTDFQITQKELLSCIESHPQRAEANLYLGLLQLKLCEQRRERQGLKGEQQLRASVFHHLTVCADRFGSSCSNYSAFIFYYRAVLAAWEGEWAVAAAEVELAIEKSQDNFFNFYYLRALVLANLQNFKQAISDASLALSIDQNPSAFLLRARCLQIDGNPGQAFADLQTFIALRPEDKQVHKFAGHLLFENGAFEDALQAYGQGEVSSTDIQVFLTRSKTHFLLGNFSEAAQDLQQASLQHPNPSDLRFDQKVIEWLASFLHQYKNSQNDAYLFDSQHLSQCLQQLRAIYKQGAEAQPKYGKIFKLPQFLTLSAACQFYGGNYESAIDSFIEAIELKQAALERGEETEGEFQQEQAQKLVFINQMYYNLSLCCCMLQHYPNAERYLRKCNISPELHNYDTYLQLLQQVAGRQAVQSDTQYLDLFSLRNKLSKYMPRIPVPFLCNTAEVVTYRSLKICIPYPKVEPPQITPPFDLSLIQQIDLNEVQRRVQAPWIFREKDSIKFTERIQVFSRFELEKSEIEEKRQQMANPSQSSLEGVPPNLREMDIRERLKLDARLQQKLNKLISKEK